MHARDFCPRCLLDEMPEGQKLAEMVRQWIDAMPWEHRTDEALYEERLQICRQCDCLFSGTCRICGCYVEYRAAMDIRHCPAVPAKW